ncbi:MAG: hypothetical protein AAGK10_21260, partial [Cyanobacteria bacterium J06555_3]
VHKRELAIGAWTVFSQDSKWLGDTIAPEQELNYIQSLTARGIDYFITDDPVRLQQVLNHC